MLGFMSGWFSLQQWYPDNGDEEPLLKLGGQSGSMGIGVHLNGCLKLRAYPSGLGIRIWRIFGVFQKPLKVPWSEIDAEPSSTLFLPMVKLNLGKPSNGTLKISRRSWARLVSAAKGATPGPLPDVPSLERGKTAMLMLAMWLAMTSIVGTFFYLSSRSEPNGMPLLGAVAVPAIFLGIVMLVQFARS
jgi:hypothetical protein